jgi:hypothetical protein
MLRQIAHFTSQQGATLGVMASSTMGTHFYPRLGIAYTGRYPIHSFKP